MESHFAPLPAALLAWFRANARDLPWRHTRDPYRIWVSEIMLQQTRVAAVLGYYARFLAAFPTVEDLAAGDEEALLSLWQGLGYYSRARSLHRAAKQIAAAGRFPDTYAEILSLPGVGEYTAGAIASAAFALPCPAVDGNALRVFSRLTDCHTDSAAPAMKRECRDFLAELFPAAEEDIRIFNQCFMELGAVLCVPHAPPRCTRCPAAEYCLGRQRGTAEALPVRGVKKERRTEERTVFVLLRQKGAEGGKEEIHTALRKRPESGLLARLWEFPNVPGQLDEAQAAETVQAWGLRVLDWKCRLYAKHLFTHVEWHMSGFVLTVEGEGNGDFRWADRVELEQYAVPSAFARFREEAVRFLSGEREISGKAKISAGNV